MICKNCGTENPAEGIFCSKCNSRLDTLVAETATSTVTQQPIQPVVQPTQESINNYNGTNKNYGKLGIIIGLACILLILIIIVILFATGVIGGNKTNNEVNNNNNNEVNNNNNNNEVKEDTKKEEKKKTYNVTDAVTTLDGSKWHVIGVKGDTVTLLLDELVVEETGYGKSAAPEDQIYENSTVKEYIDGTYMPELSAKIDAAGGDSSKIKGRVITAKEYLDLTRTKFDEGYTTTSVTAEAYDHKAEVCKILDIMSLTNSFWTATNVQEFDSSSHFYGVIYIYKESSKYSYFCNKDMTSNFAVVDLATNNNYQLNATFVGIRPVIETPTSNLK